MGFWSFTLHLSNPLFSILIMCCVVFVLSHFYFCWFFWGWWLGFEGFFPPPFKSSVVNPGASGMCVVLQGLCYSSVAFSGKIKLWLSHSASCGGQTGSAISSLKYVFRLQTHYDKSANISPEYLLFDMSFSFQICPFLLFSSSLFFPFSSPFFSYFFSMLVVSEIEHIFTE